MFIYLIGINTFMRAAQMQIMHSPRLNTVLMVEQALKEAKEIIKVSELKRRLPKKVMHSTLLMILAYLQESGKIFISPRGLVWIYRLPAEMEKLKQGGLEI